jgi:hypothetical protein
MASFFVVAEREGFEPSMPFLAYNLSRIAVSTTRTPLQVLVITR